MLVAGGRKFYVGAIGNHARAEMSLRQNLREMKETLRLSAADPGSRGARLRSWAHFLIFDHALLRLVWTNEAEIAPGVLRANHPSPARLEALAARGIRTILNLRGVSDAPHYRFERAACARLGLQLVDFEGLTARHAPSRDILLQLLDVLRGVEKPVVMHCKSGADRSSLAAAVYLLGIEGATIDAARAQFSPRFIHFRWTRTGVLDRILDTYEAAHRDTGIGFEDWLRNGYDAQAIQASFDAGRR